jgi:hypothetical protein
MSRPKPKKKPSPPLDLLRAGMPMRDSITGVDEVKTGKRVLRVIHTNEMDEYDQTPPKPQRKKRT